MATRNRTDGPVAVGIDLGTDKCVVAAVRDGRAHALENEFGQRTTPSWVAFNSQQRLVGGAVLDQAVVNCANTVSAVKRTLGRTYDQVKQIPSACRIEKGKFVGSFQYKVKYRKQLRGFHPEQITAMILTNVKQIAETSLGCEVDRAVISVPASYSIAQRGAVKTAAKIAGIEVLQLINETTAAGIAFEDNRTVTTPATIAVVDFGAGKLDVSIMNVNEKSISVVAAAGSPFLGGYDLDEILVDYCVKSIGENFSKVRIDDKMRVKLRLACEEAKITLSLLPETHISIDSIVFKREADIILRRDDFRRLIEDMIRETIIKNFELLFKEKSMKKEIIDKVVLVGGSTRIPVVKSILEEYFGSHKLDQTVNQDEAVAQGAALRAAALSGAAAGIEVSDVSSFSIGYYGGNTDEAHIVIDRFTPSSSKPHCRIKGQETELNFFERTYSAEGRACDAPLDLTLYNHDDTFSYIYVDLDLRVNESGMCSFSFFCDDSHSEISTDPGERPDSDVRRWVKEEKQLQQEAQVEMRRTDAKFELESLYSEIESAVCDIKLLECKFSYDIYTCEEILSKIKRWMTKNSDVANLADLFQGITDLRSVQKQVMQAWDAEQKIALEKAKSNQKHTEKKMIADKIFAFESHLSEVVRDLEVSDLVKRFCREQLERCKAKLCSLVAWGENCESASLTEVSQKLEELNQVEHEVDQMKESAAAREVFENLEEYAFQMFDFESDLFEVVDVLENSNFANCTHFQELDSCKAELRSLVEWKENVKIDSSTQVLLKLEELHQMKNKVDLLKANVARLKALFEEEDDVGTTLESSDEQPTNTDHFSKSKCPKAEEKSPRDGDLNLNNGMEDLSENECKSPASSYNNSSCPVESSNESSRERTDEVRSTSMSPPAAEEMEDRSNSTQLNPSSVDKVSECGSSQLQEIQSPHQLTSEEDIKPELRSVSRDDVTGHHSAPLSPEESEEDRPSSFRHCLQSENKHEEHRSQAHLDYDSESDEQEVQCQEGSSLPCTRYQSENSEQREPVVPSSSFEEQNESNEVAPEGFHSKPPIVTDEYTNQKQSVACSVGGSVDHDVNSVSVNSTTLSAVHPPTAGLPSSENCVSDLKPEETHTHLMTESASTQTNVTSPEDGRGVGSDAIPGSEEEHQSEKEAELVKKFKDMGVYVPWLEIIENVMSNIVSCERCSGLRVVCCDHRCQAFQKVSEVLNSVIEISTKSSK